MKLNILNKINSSVLILLILFILIPLNVSASFPVFTADEGIYLVETNSGDVILDQNGDERYIPASTTKIMTALVLVENVDDLDEIVTVQDEVNDYGWSDSTAGLETGMTLSYRDLLYALLVPSGNDAAGTIAINVGRKILDDPTADRYTAAAAFVDAMNLKAQELGLTNTQFVNPHGLYDPNHYTTPKEMSIIATEAFKNEEIKSAASTKAYNLRKADGTVYAINNTNALLYNDINNPYYTVLLSAAKTGMTDEGGRTFVYYSQMHGDNIVGVIFKTTQSGIFEQSKQILEELNANYSTKLFTDENGHYTTVDLENVHYSDGDSLSVSADRPISTYLNNTLNDSFIEELRWDDSKISEDENGNLELLESVDEGEKVGALIISNGNYSKTVPLYSDSQLSIKNWQDFLIENRITVLLGLITILAFIFLCIALYRYKTGKAKIINNNKNQTKF